MPADAAPRPDPLDRLGGIPLHRVRLSPPPGTATEADLERAGKPICELIDGTLVEKAMGSRESLLGGYLFRLLATHAEVARLGYALPGDGFIRLADGQVRAPDVTFLPWDVLPGGKPPDETFWQVAPALAVEVLSPTNTKAEIDRKLAELFQAGCRLAWVIDPRRRTARVYTSATDFSPLDDTGVLDGRDVVPGFRLPLAQLFAYGT